MSEYEFFTGYLRFVAARMPRDTPEIADMMEELGRIAAEIELTGGFKVDDGMLERVARAWAGLAGFLQQQILPEALAEQNRRAEAQIRWAIDTSMDLMGKLRIAAQTGGHDASAIIPLPPPPGV